MIENENFNTNVLVRRNLWGTKTFDEAKQNAADLESTLLGFSSAQMGNRTTTRPFDNGPVGQVLPNKDSWFFYFRYEERNIRVVNSRISSEGLRNPSIGNWLEKRLLSPKPTYASLDSNDLATLLFFNRFTTNTQIIPELDEAFTNPYGRGGGTEIVERDSEIISGLIREIRPGLTQASPATLDLFDKPLDSIIPTAKREAVTTFRDIYEKAAKVLIKLAFGSGGGLGSTPGQPSIGERSRITQGCIENETNKLIEQLVPEIKEQIEETARTAQKQV